MSFFSRRTIAAVAVAAVASFPLVASTAQAHETHAKKSTHSHSKPAKKFHAKFVLHGKVKAVSENSITVAVKGGNLKKGVRGTDVVLSVNETTKITIGDETKALADVVVTDRVSVKGVRTLTDGVISYAAKRIHAKHAVVKTPEPVVTATPAPVS